MALKNDGTVVTWGWSDEGKTAVPAGLSGVIGIAAGQHHTVALKADGTAVTWGESFVFSPLGPYESAIDGTVAHDPATRTATLTPSAPLELGVTYDATVNTGVRSLLGDPLAAEVRWSFTASFNPFAITTASPLPTGTKGAPYATTITATGGLKPYTWSWSKNSGSSLPTGLSLNAATGAISGTPTKTGTFSFTVKVTDRRSPAVSASKSFTLQVVAAPAPLTITTTSPLPRATVGRAYSTTLAATGGVTPYTWAVTVGVLPPGLSLNTSTGKISGTPTTARTYSFTVRVTDSRGTQTSKAFALTCR